MKRFIASLLFCAPVAQASETWKPVYVCENDEAVVEQAESDPSRYQLTLKNNDLNMYLGLGYRARTQGFGQPATAEAPFVGYKSQISSLRAAHVFPEFGGLKVQVETQPYYYCEYDVYYGDSSGQTHTVAVPVGQSCPNLYPSYGFRRARGGEDVKTSRNWFFQTCDAVSVP